MIKDGLYKVSFQTPMGVGAGVAYASGGKMWGGDSGIYYVGTYSQEGNQLTANVTTTRHTGGANSVFGVDRVHITLRGTVDGDTATTQGTAAEAPGVKFQAILTRLSD
jgi:hypothetical protein